jgi:tetratricopeptide (TPR) repeat protein
MRCRSAVFYCAVCYYAFTCLSALAQSPRPLVADTRTPAQAGPRPEVTDEMRGDIFMARKMYREAADRYKMVKPLTAAIHNKIGIAYQQLQQYGEAERSYKRASKADSKFSQAVNNLGTVYYAQKNYRKATRQYEKAIELAPENASFISNLGMAWFARKQYDRATELLAKAMALDPDVIERRGTTGTTLQDRSIEERAKFHYYLAKTYAKEGRRDLVLLYMRKSLEEGFTEREKYVKDPEFAKLQQEPEFQELLKLAPRIL